MFYSPARYTGTMCEDGPPIPHLVRAPSCSIPTVFFLVGNELRETQIVFEVGQVGISRKHGIAGKALAGSCLEPLDSQVVPVHESISRCNVICRVMKMDESSAFLGLSDLQFRKSLSVRGRVEECLHTGKQSALIRRILLQIVIENGKRLCCSAWPQLVKSRSGTRFQPDWS